jgi:hypothetical protein
MARRSQIDVLKSDAPEDQVRCAEACIRELDVEEIAKLIELFKLLDEWDRGANQNAKVM